MPQPKASLTIEIRPSDDPARVVEAVTALFPDLETPESPEASFPTEPLQVWRFEGIDLSTFLEQVGKQRIMDTALDAMALHLTDDSTNFSLSRQAALAGKVAFVLPGEHSLGGTLTVELEGGELAQWMEQVTWHEGRREVPRQISDTAAMMPDGGVTEWFDVESL